MLILTGYTKVCKKTSGGVLTIGLIEKENFKGATLDADSDAYSAITLAAQSAFSKYEFLEDEAEFKEDTKRENGSVVITKSLVFKLPTMNAQSRAGDHRRFVLRSGGRSDYPQRRCVRGGLWRGRETGTSAAYLPVYRHDG